MKSWTARRFELVNVLTSPATSQPDDAAIDNQSPIPRTSGCSVRRIGSSPASTYGRPYATWASVNTITTISRKTPSIKNIYIFLVGS
jgi:hypothetical protein